MTILNEDRGDLFKDTLKDIQPLLISVVSVHLTTSWEKEEILLTKKKTNNNILIERQRTQNITLSRIIDKCQVRFDA